MMQPNVEDRIVLDKFVPRWYQRDIWDKVEKEQIKRHIIILPRRAGKDIMAWNLAIRQCLRKTCLVYYCLPTFAHGKRCVWDAIAIDGTRFIDFVPPRMIERINNQEMKIVFKNNSMLVILGAEDADRTIVGTNPYAIIMSEFALMNNALEAWNYARPILAANGGWFMALSTPRGKNHMWAMYKNALELPDWHTVLMGVDQTKHISDEVLEQERSQMTEDLFLQEYYCSFDRGQQGSIYGREMDTMRAEGRISAIPHEHAQLVNVAIDIGVKDATTLVFWQSTNDNSVIKIIDCYSNTGMGLDHYAKILQDKPYRYNKYFAPHDLMVREWGGGAITRYEKARQLGLNFEILEQVQVQDGIDNVRVNFPKFYIDERNCKSLINALENYRREWDEKRQIYSHKPYHDANSHYCFEGDTQVLTPLGSIPIKDIKVGDKVITPFGEKTVTHTHSRFTQDLAYIHTNYGILKTTPQHSIFTRRGLVKSDSLRYNDVLEHHTKMKGLMWKMISVLYGEESVSKGFKKNILSLKMKNASSLMDFYIAGMVHTSRVRLPLTNLFQRCNALYGYIIMAPFLRSIISIIKMAIRRITTFQIWNVFRRLNTLNFTVAIQIHGLNQLHVKNSWQDCENLQRNGTEVKREENGIGNMRSSHYLALQERNIQKNASSAQKNSMETVHGQSSAQMHAKPNKESNIRQILSIVHAKFVQLSSFVINMLSRKHVVDHVELFQCDTPKQVYDITVQDDQCYYANGYLVSNSDAIRYMCQALHKTARGMSPEEFNLAKARALMGNKPRLPLILDKNFKYKGQ